MSPLLATVINVASWWSCGNFVRHKRGKKGQTFYVSACYFKLVLTEELKKDNEYEIKQTRLTYMHYTKRI